MPAHRAQSHFISICVKRSASLSDMALKKSRPRKLKVTLRQVDQGSCVSQRWLYTVYDEDSWAGEDNRVIEK